jgi:orotidine-5'-phosphate decarboxylase
MKRNTGLILALDTEYETAALELLGDVYNYIDGVKVGYQLVLSEGLRILGVIKSEFPQLPVILDLKLMDAPHIARHMIRLAIDSGADVVVVCGVCGPTVLAESALLARRREKRLLVFLEFTQFDGLIDAELANRAALIAKENGAWGILAPGTKPRRITELRSLVGNGMAILSCGIGAQGPRPGTAIAAGADYEIIGREICSSARPQMAAANIADSLSTIISAQQRDLLDVRQP